MLLGQKCTFTPACTPFPRRGIVRDASAEDRKETEYALPAQDKPCYLFLSPTLLGLLLWLLSRVALSWAAVVGGPSCVRFTNLASMQAVLFLLE